jgi:hypothetical protein
MVQDYLDNDDAGSGINHQHEPDEAALGAGERNIIESRTHAKNLEAYIAKAELGSGGNYKSTRGKHFPHEEGPLFPDDDGELAEEASTFLAGTNRDTEHNQALDAIAAMRRESIDAWLDEHQGFFEDGMAPQQRPTLDDLGRM